VYTFKHALVQDAAYDPLLKSRRQELHTKIARVIEQRFPSIKTTEPEMLAHHLTAGGLAEAAVPLWQAAGELAVKRLAMAEAISHLSRGLELAATLPRSSQRDASELGLRSFGVDGAQGLGHPGSFRQLASGPGVGEVARAPRRAAAHPSSGD
jgi:predicted ATPase